jgi:Mg2+ and Co2+ transporter CorA
LKAAPIEQINGETPDLSEYLDFGFYDWVWYKDNTGVGEKMCGRWLGVSHRVGNLMLYWILTPVCRVISRTTVQRISNLELATIEVKDRCKDYNERIKELMHDDNHVIQDEGERQLQDWDDYTDNQDEDLEDEYNRVVSDNEIPEADHTFTSDTFVDTYLDKEVALA